jgi:putative ABC transport system permease protein
VSAKARLRSLLSALRDRSGLERDIHDELRFHLEARAEDLARSGMPRAEAERQARLEFGSVERYEEDCREARGLRWPDELRQDLRFAIRGLRRNPGFAAVAVLTLALGIGVDTAMLTVAESVLRRPLPYRDPSRLVMVHSVGSFGPFSWRDGPFADPDYLELRRLGAFSDLASFATFESSLTGAGEPVRALRSDVTPSLFPLLGVAPALGRVFRDGEEPAGAVAVLSDALWRGRFHADRGVIGRVENVDGVPTTIVGVMPPAFNFPPKTELWTALRIRPAYRDNAINHVVGRLASGIGAEQARAQASTLMAAVGLTLPPAKRNADVVIVGLRESLVGKARPLLLVLLGAVGFVLLIACANMASLLMARAAARRQEMSLRAVLGAGRARLLRQMLTESLVLAVLGGVAGLALARVSLPVLLAWVPPNMLPRIDEVRIDVAVVAAAGALCLGTAVLFGLAPAWWGSRRDLGPSQKHRVASASTPAERRVRGGLVIAETALVMVLLVGAGLLLKSFWSLQRVDPGFRRDGILTMAVSLPDRVYATVDQKRVFYDRLLDRLRRVPGAGEASAVNLLPFGTQLWRGDFSVEGADGPSDFVVGKPAVSEGYFRLMGIPLRRGRFFDARDGPEAPRVAIVSEAVARRCWPGRDAIGRRFTMDDPKENAWRTVVGVVGDIRQDTLAGETVPMIYVPARQEWRGFFLGSMTFLARTPGDPAALASALRAEVRALDPELPVQRIERLDDLLAGSLAQPRFRTALLLAFALLALLLALVGIYGVTAYEVTRRTPEIGIRRALGAQTSAVVRLVVGRSLGLVLAGLAVGIPSALALTRVLESFLFAVSPADLATFLAVTVAVTIAALLASAVPARRATRVDPAVALRSD